MDVSGKPNKENYCELCQMKITDRKAHVHSTGHILKLVDPENEQLVKEYLSNMQRPLVY